MKTSSTIGKPLCYLTATQTGNRRNQRLPAPYHIPITLPHKKTRTENTRTESSFQEIRKNLKIPVENKRLPKRLSSSVCGGGVGVCWEWGSSTMGLEFEFNIRVVQSSQVVPSVRPRGQKGPFYYASPLRCELT